MSNNPLYRIAPLKRTDKPMKMDYGHFTQDFSFCLTDPATTRPWQHLLANDEYLLNVSQLGTGFSCYKSRFGNQLTKNDGFDDYSSGRFFYIRNARTGDVFSPTAYPVHRNLDGYGSYRCVYGHGYMKWMLLRNCIRCTLTAFVNRDTNIENFILDLHNDSSDDVTLDVFFYLDWVFERTPSTYGCNIETEFSAQRNILTADKVVPPEYRFHQTAFISSTEKILDFDTRQLAFIGPMHTYCLPLAVEQGACFNSLNPTLGSTCGAVRVRVSMQAGQSKEILFVHGCAEHKGLLNQIVSGNNTLSAAKKNLQKVQAYWNAYYDRQVLEEPTNPITSFTNTWLKYQLIHNAQFDRHAAWHGFRDQMQDAAGVSLIDSDRARYMILRALSYQKSNGFSLRFFYPYPWQPESNVNAVDSSFWILYAVDQYIAETNDVSILDEMIPYIDTKAENTVWHHILCAVDYYWQNRGKNGLCRMGEGDWNDSLNKLGEDAESVWMTQAVCYGLLSMIALAQKTGKSDVIIGFKEKYEYFKDALTLFAWDGKWFIRATNADGRVGSVQSKDGGKLFLNSQAWAILSRTANPNQISCMLEAVDEYLMTEVGPLLYAPKYTAYDPNIGRCSIGASEANSIYVHAVMFYIKSLCMLKLGDKAYDILERVLPLSRKLPAEQTGAEPFCCVNAFAGDKWAWPGWSYIGWWTGTASWMLKILVEDIFGAKGHYDGLMIDPCLPSNWENACLRRTFQNATYHIKIKKERGICKGRIILEVDGKKLDTNIVPSFKDGQEHIVLCKVIR